MQSLLRRDVLLAAQLPGQRQQQLPPRGCSPMCLRTADPGLHASLQHERHSTVPPGNSSDNAEPMRRTERRAFSSEPLRSCGGQAALPSPNCFCFVSWACLELLQQKSKCLVRGALPSNALAAEAFVLLQSS